MTPNQKKILDFFHHWYVIYSLAEGGPGTWDWFETWQEEVYETVALYPSGGFVFFDRDEVRYDDLYVDMGVTSGVPTLHWRGEKLRLLLLTSFCRAMQGPIPKLLKHYDT